MSQYKISVIIPTYNTGDFLYESFNSILNQTIGFSNIEVIIVDDASTDTKTLNHIKDLESKYENCKAIFLEDNSGFPGRGRNIGLAEAKGEYVIVADHDDSYNSDAFERLYSEITSNNADVAISNFNQVYDDKTVPFKSVFKDTLEIHVRNVDENLDLLKIPAAIWTRLFRKEFLTENNIKFLEGMLAEDVYVASLSSLKANGIVYLNSFYGYNYRIRDSQKDKSTIHIRNRKYIEAMLNGYFEIVKALDSENLERYGEIIFRQHLTSWIYTIVLSDLSGNDRLDLFKKAYPVFDKYYSEDKYFNGKYNKIIECILAKDFDRAVSQSFKVNKLSNKVISKIKKMI